MCRGNNESEDRRVIEEWRFVRAFHGSITCDGVGRIVTDTTGANGDGFKYTGREWDATAQLQYNRARYYDPAIGKWISIDPLGFDAGDANLYRYPGNGATNGVDPSGLEVFYIFVPVVKPQNLTMSQYWWLIR